MNFQAVEYKPGPPSNNLSPERNYDDSILSNRPISRSLSKGSSPVSGKFSEDFEHVMPEGKLEELIRPVALSTAFVSANA